MPAELIDRIVAFLAAHGPATLYQVADALEADGRRVEQNLWRHLGRRVTKVGTEPRDGKPGRPAALWAVIDQTTVPPTAA